ncbi:unnamed protein product, partial [Brenthis ino]
MSTFAFLLLCLQACLVQNVYSQWCGAGPAYGLATFAEPCGCGYGDFGYFGPGAYAGYGMGLGAPGLGPYAFPSAAGAYGGEGIGDVAIIGQMPVGGTTVIGGQVPILGAVEFGGAVPAAGAVTIAGSCGCGCRTNRPYCY